jgi:hypothetical protein
MVGCGRAMTKTSSKMSNEERTKGGTKAGVQPVEEVEGWHLTRWLTRYAIIQRSVNPTSALTLQRNALPLREKILRYRNSTEILVNPIAKGYTIEKA